MLNRLRDLLRSRLPTERAALARQAGEWLENETLNVALAAMRDSAVKTWMMTGSRKKQRECWHELRRIDAFVRVLRKLVEKDTAERMLERRREQGIDRDLTVPTPRR